MPQRESPDIGPGGEPIVLTAIDLHLVLEEQVIQVARHRSACQTLVGSLENVWSVGQVVTLSLGHRDVLPGDRDTTPGTRQLRQQRPARVPIDLRSYRGSRGGTIGTRKVTEKIVEAAVLRIDHHDIPDIVAQAARVVSRP